MKKTPIKTDRLNDPSVWSPYGVPQEADSVVLGLDIDQQKIIMDVTGCVVTVSHIDVVDLKFV
jgi:hypothetical protein